MMFRLPLRAPPTLFSRSTRKQNQAGFALIATISVMVLLVMIALAMLSLSTIEIKQISHMTAKEKAQANARMALIIAIGELQKYAGPDQRITARADITAPDWQDLDTQLQHPNYTLVWDVGGSEIDYSLNKPEQKLNLSTDNHRPGMDPGHDFKKVPAVLVSGNEFFNLAPSSGKDAGIGISATQYPQGYITAQTDLSNRAAIELIPRESIMQRDSLTTGKTPLHSISVPLVKLPDQSMYAWWVGDESLKARINQPLKHDPASVASRMMAQRAPINPYQQSTDSTASLKQTAFKNLSVSFTALAYSSADQNHHSLYSPDISVTSNSLLTDTRNAGLKEDFTFALFNPELAAGMPESLKNNQFLIDPIDAGSWGNYDATAINNNGGLAPYFGYLRKYAQLQLPLTNAQPVPLGEHGIAPVLSQAQAAIHAALKTNGSKFKIYFSVFPSVSLWNPYNVPILIDKKIVIKMQRRSITMNWWLYSFKANYKIQRDGGSDLVKDDVFSSDSNHRGGWIFQMIIDPENTGKIIIPPGKSMVFSPEKMTQSDTPVAPNPREAWKRTTFSIYVKPGWNPGKGHLFNLDNITYDASNFVANATHFPKISFGLGGVSADNILWTATYENSGAKHLSYWSRMSTSLASDSPFFAPPKVSDANQDTRGNFPGLLYKYSLRTGDDYLTIPDDKIHPQQSTLLFPYMANYNPRAIFHAGIGDTYAQNKSSHAAEFHASEGTEISPSLMGGLYDFQNAQSIYTVPTCDNLEQFTYIGNGYLGSEQMITSEIPPKITEPNGQSASITSFTQLNHSNLMVGARLQAGATRYNWFSTSNMPAYPIGNSLGDFRLNLDESALSFTKLSFLGSVAKLDNQGQRVRSTHYDTSYLLNDYFYDHYFFSTVPQSGVYSADQALIHSKLTPLTSKHEELKSINSASQLMLAGGFNVNSTSVPAWEMLLSSSLGVQYNDVTSGQNEPIVFANRIDATGGSFAQEMTEGNATTGDQHMLLNQDEVKELAEAMVKEVKRRGPFPSLSAFVNRTKKIENLLRNNDANHNLPADTYSDVRYSGAIQSALDSIQVNLELEKTKNISPSDFVQDKRIYPGNEALRKSANSHLPGYLKQSDILRQIEPSITVRGDTFLIRTVGVSMDKNGRVLAKAACEAVVQRRLQYLDPSQPPETKPYDINDDGNGKKTLDWNLTSINRRYGRAFKVISFHWLTSTEMAKMKITH